MTLPPVTFTIPYHAVQSGEPGLLIGVLEKQSSPKRPEAKARRVLLYAGFTRLCIIVLT